ncbi:hypothetical protein C3747_4g732 [Trypanosoma cruzi]|uniref:Transmembrane protein n=2 Tax=Trypanosoma cruzi TaxID=5693 RepID=Q4D2K2_TRYCC|nr:hypothetical protein, conserved [Trypanosoma cruzi]EAN86755.1 hypothetical protein, conserved [Trypanosoma cruzi]PWV20872.1 hypothetical protein C3747_4g732 [Trypanosoma cruzi]RNC49249.1 hypothetical protein TcCL_NonESM00796 [Trypanosoma cruzi]|eukprot:XP_808606.1 hypothetical protein [Trypanosoma cruzi strain CL Brener]
MSSLNETLDQNTSTVYSDTNDGGQTGDTSRAEEQGSLLTSHRTMSETDLRTGSFLDEEQTQYEYTTGYDSRTYYSRTFETRTYDDSSFPQSPRSDELSSTFASFYMESEAARKVKSTIFFLRRPLIFFFMTLSGSGGIGTMCRVVHAITVAATQRHARHITSPLNDLNSLPDGYPSVPEWMRQARLALPSIVEVLVKKLLRTCGVPALADLQKDRWAAALGSLESAREEIISQTTHVVSGPMVPLVIFLPLFSFSVISIARRIVALRQVRQAEEEEEFQQMGIDEAEKVGIPHSAELSAIQEAEASNMSVDGAIVHTAKFYENREVTKSAVVTTSEVAATHVSVETNVSSFIKRPTGLHSPSENQTSPHTVPTSRDLSPVSVVTEDAMKTNQVFGANGPDSPLPQERVPLQGLNVAPYALKGDVVAALLGTPTVKEVNVLLIAASRYNCRRVIIPSRVAASSLVSVSPSLSIERTDDVLQHVMSVEEPRGLTTVAVFLRPVTDDAVELSAYKHPSAAVYVFLAASGVEEDVVAHLVDQRIYSASSLDEPMPANACFYDRSVKEREGTVDVY